MTYNGWYAIKPSQMNVQIVRKSLDLGDFRLYLQSFSRIRIYNKSNYL